MFGIEFTPVHEKPEVRCGSIATEIGWPRDVRFPPESDRIADIPDRQLRANC
jgi:hypothetical protein